MSALPPLPSWGVPYADAAVTLIADHVREWNLNNAGNLAVKFGFLEDDGEVAMMRGVVVKSLARQISICVQVTAGDPLPKQGWVTFGAGAKKLYAFSPECASRESSGSPSTQAQELSAIFERLATSHREQSVAAETAHQLALQTMQAESAKALTLVMEGVRDNTAAVAKTQRLKTESVDSHAVVVVGVSTPLATRLKYPRMRFAPLEPENKVFGACSREALAIYMAVVTEGEAIFEDDGKAGNGDTAKRKEVVALLQGDPAHSILLRRWFLGNSKDEKDPFCRWSIAFESWTARFKGDFEKKVHKDKVTAKFFYAMVADDDITYTSESAALMSDAGLDRATTVPGLNFKPPRYYEEKNGLAIAPLHPTMKKIKFLNVKGGGKENTVKPVAAAPVAPSPPASEVFYSDLQPSAYVSDWLLDFVNMSLAAVHGRSEVKVISADLVRNWVSRGAGDEMRRALDSRWAEPLILAPLLVRGDHWVLLRISRNAIKNFDSLRSHTGDVAHRFVRSLAAAFPQLKEARVESEKNWPQQSPGSNDCAFFVMRAVQHVLAKQPVQEVAHFFGRRALNSLLPRIPGADRDGERSSGFLKTLQLTATKDAFKKRLVEHLAEPAKHFPVGKTFSFATLAQPKSFQTSDKVINKAPCVQFTVNPSTPATAKPPMMESVVAPLPQAPKPVLCPWPKCSNMVTLPHGRGCDGCGGRFCTRHRGRWAGAKWRCAKCVEAQTLDAPCGFHKCSIQGGVVKFLEAIKCTECKKFFHKRHANNKFDKKKLVFHCGDCKKGYHRQDFKKFSMQPTLSLGVGADIAPDPHNAPVHKTEPPLPHANDPGDTGFRVGQGSPLLATTAGKFLAMLRGNMRTVVHPLADKGITAESRREHVRLLLMLLAKAPAESHAWPVARMILEVIERERVLQRWSWVTVENKTGQMSSAMGRLPQYTGGALPSMHLIHDHEWRDASRHIRRLSKRAMPTGLPSVTEAEVVRMIETSSDPQIKAALILIWACVARSGDVSQLKTSGVSVVQVKGVPRKGRRAGLSVFFQRGKVIGKVDPYTVHTAIPETWAAWLQNFLHETMTDYLFQMPSKVARQRFLDRLRVHVRTVAPLCDLRALRRGSAQNLAEKGVAMSTIMLFTRHADVSMLRRYLRFGKTISEEAMKGTAAASRIWPTSC